MFHHKNLQQISLICTHIKDTIPIYSTISYSHLQSVYLQRRAWQYASPFNNFLVNLSDFDVSMSLILILVLYNFTLHILPMTPEATRSKAWVCGRSLAGIAGSNPAGGREVCVLWMLCVVRWRLLRQADHSSRRVLSSVVCLSMTVKPR